MKKNTLFIAITAVIALTAGVLSHLPTSPEVSETVLLRTELPDLLGKSHRLKEWQGKILVLNFWATWCPPCLEEIPAFIALQKRYADKNLQFVGIAIDNKDAVLAYQVKRNINYPILLAENSGITISKQWGNVISSVPFTVILSPQGKIIYRQLGELSQEKVLEVIAPFLKVQ